MKQVPSSRKVNEEARSKIASILLTEVSDPRLDLITVTDAQVSVDRSLAIIYISASPERYDEVLEGLNSAKGRIRSLFGRNLGWRVTPELKFEIDTTADQASRIDEALKNKPTSLNDEDNDVTSDEDDATSDEDAGINPDAEDDE